MADGVVDVEVRVVDPHRTPEIERYEPHDLPVARDERQLRAHPLADLVERRLRSVEDRDGRDVHVADAVLDVKERSVERTQPFSGHQCTEMSTGGRILPTAL